MSIPDTKKAGRSKLVPFVPGESPMDRHERRLRTNLEAIDDVRAWSKSRDVRFTVKNSGHHWIFEKGKRIVEWWPSSAKLVVQKRWTKGVHVHDYEQAKQRVANHLLSGRV